MTDRSQIVEPHPTDEGKFQAVFSDYGHGEGNGKSRQSVYKQFKKFKEQELLDEISSESSGESTSSSGTQTMSSSTDEPEDTVRLDETWGKMSWAETGDGETVKPDTIPALSLIHI